MRYPVKSSFDRKSLPSTFVWSDSPQVRGRALSPRCSLWGRGVSALLLGLGAFLFGSPAEAHNDFEIDVYGGYGLSGSVPVEGANFQGQVSVDGAPVYGLMAGYRLEKDGFIYLSYSRQETMMHFFPKGQSTAGGSRGASFDWIQFGGYVEAWRGPLAPYFGFSLGTTRTAALGTGLQNWSFSAVLDAGVKLELLSFLHLRLMGRVPVTLIGGESRVFCLVGERCVATLSGEPLVQGQLLLGLGVGF